MLHSSQMNEMLLGSHATLGLVVRKVEWKKSISMLVVDNTLLIERTVCVHGMLHPTHTFRFEVSALI